MKRNKELLLENYKRTTKRIGNNGKKRITRLLHSSSFGSPYFTQSFAYLLEQKLCMAQRVIRFEIRERKS